MIYGYARVSSKGQHLDRQISLLLNAGVEEKNILCDKETGTSFQRKNYNFLVGTETNSGLLRKDDCLYVCDIFRLGRNYTEITEQWRKITKEIGAHIVVLDMGSILDTRTYSDKGLDMRFVSDLVLQILSYVAEKELLKKKETQRQGIEAARARGVHLGRPPISFPEHWELIYNEWKAGKITAVSAMKQLNLKKNTFYKLVKQYEANASALK